MAGKNLQLHGCASGSVLTQRNVFAPLDTQTTAEWWHGVIKQTNYQFKAALVASTNGLKCNESFYAFGNRFMGRGGRAAAGFISNPTTCFWENLARIRVATRNKEEGRNPRKSVLIRHVWSAATQTEHVFVPRGYAWAVQRSSSCKVELWCLLR